MCNGISYEVRYLCIMGKQNNKIVTCSLPVVGLGCAACAVRVDKTLHEVEGVETASVNFAASTAQISFNRDTCSVEKIRKAVQDAGYDLLIEDKEVAAAHAKELRQKNYRKMIHNCIGAWSLAVPIMVLSMFFKEQEWVGYVTWIGSTISLFFFGRSFFIGAWNQLRHMSFNMDSLVANSTGIAYLFSLFNLFFPSFWLDHGITPHLYFETASGLIAFILLGRMLEERAKQRTSKSIEKLINLRPKRVTIITAQGERKIAVSQVQKNDMVLVHSGERIPVDGVIVEGESYVDESTLSGEPIPVHKTVGSQVSSGTINGKGTFKFRAEKVGDQTVLAQIIRMVEQAQGSRAPIQNVVDRVAGVFVPVIIFIALLTFFAWYVLAPEEGFSHGLLTMMTVLVIACPCALGLATPTAIMVGIGRGAEAGILIKDADSLQMARRIDTVVLDKTGTLTQGKPAVVEKHIVTGCEQKTAILSMLESHSQHPLAKAIHEAFEGDVSLELTNFEEITGEGVRGTVGGTTYWVGNEKLLKKQHIEPENEFLVKAEEWQKKGCSLIWFFDSKRILALVGLLDPLKETSQQAVQELQNLGIEVCLLTGDNLEAAQRAARQVGIQRVVAGVSPMEKTAFISQLQSQDRCVAMVGDGINDSGALALADLSVAMGQGSDIAVDASQVTILSSDLSKVAEMIRLSQATMRILHQNLFWAFIYNSISVPIAAGVLYPFFGVLLHPMIGGVAMAFSSVSVVSNSLRLRRAKLHK